MPATVPPAIAIAAAVEYALALIGVLLIWRLVLRAAARAARAPSPLLPWTAGPNEFFVFLAAVLGSYLFAGVGAGMLARQLGLVGDAVTVFAGTGGQLGMLAGLVIYRAACRPPPATTATKPNAFVSGAATFLMALPVIMVMSKLWELALQRLGLPVDKQDQIEILIRAESPWLVVTMIFLATIVAPVTEELVFRAGFFRYLRTRLSRVLAYLLPATLFASLHVNWANLVGLVSFVPLILLAVIFSAAYERTGRIGTPIVAHALFNLNALLLVFAGAGRDL